MLDLKSVQNSIRDFIKNPEEKGLKAPFNRLSVYRDGYYARLFEALQETFEVTFKIAGEDQSRKWVASYMWEFPSRTPNLSNVGIAMPEFLKNQPLTQKHPFLPDLALFEWKFSLSFHAFNQPQLSAQDLNHWLTTHPIESLTLKLQPSVQLIQSNWPITHIWKNPHHSKHPETQYILLFRPEYDVHFQLLDSAAFNLLTRLSQGTSLDEASSTLAHINTKNVLTDIQQWFAQWMAWGIFTQGAVLPTQG